VVPVGTPKSPCVVASPFSHFQISLSFASFVALSFTRRIDFNAVRQPGTGVAAH